MVKCARLVYKYYTRSYHEPLSTPALDLCSISTSIAPTYIYIYIYICICIYITAQLTFELVAEALEDALEVVGLAKESSDGAQAIRVAEVRQT